MVDPTMPGQVAVDAKAQAVLDRLHPLLQPEPPSWMPQTVGWAVLGAILTAVVTWALWRAARRWFANRFRRLALAELHQLRDQLQSPDTRVAAARRLPELVRRLALAHAPRDQVAGLQGDDWSHWLDRSLPADGQAFSQGVWRQLSRWAYRPPEDLPWDEIDPLLALLERWMRQHQIPGASSP